MIIFVEDTNIMELLPLFRQETNSFDLNNKPNTVFNLSSLVAMGKKVDLTPPMGMDVYDDRAFDMAYASYILTNNAAFISFYEMMFCNYLGFNVFILVGGDPARAKITESLMKFIAQRYTLIPRYIVEFDDIPDYYEEDHVYVDGLFNIDSDRERYVYLTTSVEQLEEVISSGEQ